MYKYIHGEGEAIKERKLFPLVWGLRFFLLAAAEAAGGRRGRCRGWREAAGPGQGLAARAARLAQRSAGKGIARSSGKAAACHGETDGNFQVYVSSLHCKLAMKASLLLLPVVIIMMREFPVRKSSCSLLQEIDSKCQCHQTMSLRSYLESNVLRLETSEYFPSVQPEKDSVHFTNVQKSLFRDQNFAGLWWKCPGRMQQAELWCQALQPPGKDLVPYTFHGALEGF